MKIAVDTNVLVRAAVRDDDGQARAAMGVLAEATLIAVSAPCLCEFVWVLARAYGFNAAACALAVRALLNTENVVADRLAAEAGLAMLEAGGDFADGVLAHEGRRLGGESFVSFDRKAVELLHARGEAARLL